MFLILVASFFCSSMASPLGENEVARVPRVFRCESGPGEEAPSPDSDELAVRSFFLNKSRHWPRGVVHYVMDPAFTRKQVKMIEEAMKKLSAVSCVRWVKRSRQRDYVSIDRVKNPGLCSATVGRVGGKQWLRLSDDCFDVANGYQGAIAHEMMHTIGFIHEQQRVDRDCYVRVAQQVVEERPFDYAIVPTTSTDFPYDFASLMQYGSSNFMKSSKGGSLGNFEGELTEMDVMKLNNMYCGGGTFCEQRPDECQSLLEAQELCRKD